MTSRESDLIDETGAGPASAEAADGATPASPEGTPPEPEGPSTPPQDPDAAEPPVDAGPDDDADPGSATDPDSPVGEDGAAEEYPEPESPDRTAELEAERDRLRDRHLRLAADFDNFRKRTEERVRRRWDSAQADLVGRLLDPMDDLLRVTTLEPGSGASVEAIVEGVDLVERKFMHALEEAGVETVDPAGEPFDPKTMEAMMRVATDSEEMDDTVAQVFQRGYTLRGLLIRPARVSVYKCQ